MPHCAVDHKSPEVIDPSGAHASSCSGSAKTRYGAHQAFSRALQRLSAKAGFASAHEPTAKALLGDRFTEDQCRGLFPKQSSGASRSIADDLKRDLDAFFDPRADDATRCLAQDSMRKTLERIPPKTEMLRIDCSLTDTRSAAELWVDVNYTHGSCASYREGQLSFHLASLQAEREQPFRAPKHLPELVSPALQKAVAAKEAKYLPLVTLANLQQAHRQRATVPRFFAACVTHAGEFSPAVFALIEAVCVGFKQSFDAAFPRSFISKPQAVAGFRSALKDSVIMCLVSGFGKQLRTSGFPRPCDVRPLNRFSSLL